MEKKIRKYKNQSPKSAGFLKFVLSNWTKKNNQNSFCQTEPTSKIRPTAIENIVRKWETNFDHLFDSSCLFLVQLGRTTVICSWQYSHSVWQRFLFHIHDSVWQNGSFSLTKVSFSYSWFGLAKWSRYGKNKHSYWPTLITRLC